MARLEIPEVHIVNGSTDTNLFSAYGLYLAQDGWKVTLPEIRSKLIEVPGRNGYLDISKALTGSVEKGTQKVECVLKGKFNQDSATVCNTFFENLHGKEVKIYRSDDDEYLQMCAYVGIIECDVEYNGHILVATLNMTAQPDRVAK